MPALSTCPRLTGGRRWHSRWGVSRPLCPERVLAEAGELRQPGAGWGHLLGQCVLDLILDLALQAKKHNLTVNLTTFRVWCYACEKEVFPEPRLTPHLPGSAHKFSEQVAGRSGVSPMGGDMC